MRPVIKLKNLNQWVEAPHGGDCYFEGPSEIRGLDGKGGSEGCLLYHPNSSLTSTVTEVHCEGDVLPIHLSPFRPLLCPMDFHQGNECMGRAAQVTPRQPLCITTPTGPCKWLQYWIQPDIAAQIS